MHFFDAMHLFCAAIFLFIGKGKSEDVPENATDVMERMDKYQDMPPDFRCFKRALKDLILDRDYRSIFYATKPHPKVPGETIGCLNIKVGKKRLVYPPLTGRDPMMEFYIGHIYAGMEYATTEKTYRFSSGFTPLTRRKEYCNDMTRIVPAFPEYWETFHCDGKTCLQMMEVIKGCHIYRQIRESYNSKLYEKLCLDEAGCYNVMEYYEDDLPYCVKYTAIHQFRNASVGSWHHSIINYCKLTDMVSGLKETKYEQSIIKGKAKIDLRKMCLYLRHRLLPDEGKETEMPDPDELYEEDVTTTAQYGSGISEIATFWTITIVVVAGYTYQAFYSPQT